MGGTNHLGPGGRSLEAQIGRDKSLRTWRNKLESNSDLEGQIGILPLRTWRHKLKSNSDLEAQITSDLEAQIGFLRHKLRITQAQIEILQAQIENRPGTN